MSRLECTHCWHHYQRTEFLQRCPSCNEPLEVQVDLAGMRGPSGDLAQDKRIVCLITGHGIKDISVLEHQGVEVEKARLQDLHRAIEAHL